MSQNKKKKTKLTNEYGLIQEAGVINLLKLFHVGCEQTMEKLLKEQDYTVEELIILQNALTMSVTAVFANQVNKQRAHLQKRKQPRIVRPGLAMPKNKHKLGTQRAKKPRIIQPGN